jgi:hypothetical protein
MDKTKEEKLVGNIQIGKMAEMAYQHLIPLLKEEHESALAQLKSVFLEGMKDMQRLNMELARLVVVDNLEQRLKSQIGSSNRARKELENESS